MHIIHETIGIPTLKLDATSKTKATLTMTPLPTGFGSTIGNSLRRVLYNSLPGTAITGFKIEGITHEFTSIDGVKESVFDIGLNLRELRLKKKTKDIEMISVELQKNKTITAADLKVSSGVEILDPTQVICTCGDVKKTKIEMRVERGVGSRMIETEQSRDEKDSQIMLLDSVFSPVIDASYVVEQARVGDNTKLDKLVLEVETNGSLDAIDALKYSANMLREYYALFAYEDVYKSEEHFSHYEQLKRQRDAENSVLNSANGSDYTPIDELRLSQRTQNSLLNGGVDSVEKLVNTPLSQIMNYRGFGERAKKELEEVLGLRGLGLKE